MNNDEKVINELKFLRIFKDRTMVLTFINKTFNTILQLRLCAH